MAKGLGINGIRKGLWSRYEDVLLIVYVHLHGPRIRNWKNVPEGAGLNRDGNSCRNRWENHLRPGLKRGNFTPDEDELIMKKYRKNMKKHNKPHWARIARRLSGRTAEGVRNRGITLLNEKQHHEGGGVHDSSPDQNHNPSRAQPISSSEVPSRGAG